MEILKKIWKALPFTGLQLFAMRILHDQFLVASAGFFFDDKGRILLFKHKFRNGNAWGIPSGYMKKSEHPREALEREVREESALIVTEMKKLGIRTDRNSPRLEVLYLGKVVGGKIKRSEEISEIGFFDTKNLPSMPEKIKNLIIKAKVIYQKESHKRS